MAARLGLYVDDVYRLVATPNGQVISSDRAFLVFAAEVADRFDTLVLFGRAEHADGDVEHELPARTEIVELPLYEDLTHLSEVIRATPATVRRMWQGLARVDIVWIFGPHPFALVLALLALVRRKRIVLGVRQDTRAYYRNRLRRPIWAPALALTSATDRAFRFLARRTAVTTVGPDITRSYGGGSRVLDMTVTLVRSADVAEHPGEHAWTEAIGLLAVGRLEQEKNPLLLVQALEQLEALRPGRYSLTWVGRGPLEEEVLRAARTAGLSDRVELPGYVPYGDELLDRYRNAHLFVHVSLTEGLPQVLVEALASGTPIVATAVGSVGALLEEGGAGVLVRPAQLEELVDAILLLSDDEPLRRRLATRGIELAQDLTIEREGERVARFIAAAAAASLPP